uniref:Uncharacterized protein n=1 Tax=Rhizophora mucronata TaxID=61149 RepID=A0A2P2J046_RHIMU
MPVSIHLRTTSHMELLKKANTGQENYVQFMTEQGKNTCHHGIAKFEKTKNSLCLVANFPNFQIKFIPWAIKYSPNCLSFSFSTH